MKARRLMFVVLSSATLAAIPDTTWAACGTYNAAFSLNQYVGHASDAVSSTWNTLPAFGGCGFTLHHYAVCYQEGTTAPSTPVGGGGVKCNPAGTSTSDSLFVYRSNTDFAAKVFACGNASCTTWYGDGTRALEVETSSTDTVLTGRERWVLTSVSSLSDNTIAVLDNNASASTALFYPNAWSAGDQLGMWWSVSGGSGIDTISYKSASSTGWMDFNVATYSSTSTVLESISGATDYACTHPWAVAATDGTSDYIELFMNCDDNGNPTSGDSFRVTRIASDDDLGSDFGLSCSLSPNCGQTARSGICPNGDLCDMEDKSSDGSDAMTDAILAIPYTSGTLSTDHDIAGHGRIIWDYLLYPELDFSTDDPGMVYTGAPLSSSCSAIGGSTDDLYIASWDGTEWVTPVDPGTGCVDTDLPDLHDPGVMPLPNQNGFKMYAKSGTTQFYVCYSDDGTTWDSANCQTIELAFDDGTLLGSLSTGLQSCLQNIDVLIYDDGTAYKKGAFFRAVPDDATNTCFASSGTPFGGIVFAEHRN